jgi:hypothetical protein
MTGQASGWEAGAFTAEVAPNAMRSPAGVVPLATGNWRPIAPAATAEITVAADRQLLRDMPGYHPTGLREVEARG